MSNRSWKVCTQAALAITAGVMALATGIAGPASAAGSPVAPAITATQGQFSPVLSNVRVANAVATDNVTAFHGFSTFKSVTIQSQGFDLEGTIHGTIHSYDYKALYQVYNLSSSESWGVWVAQFKHDTSQDVLKQTFNHEEKLDLAVDIKFKVSAAALRGVSTLRIGFETMRLVFDGVTKDFTVVNGASGGAKDQNGNDIPVDFQPV